jgi:hypothetical protein
VGSDGVGVLGSGGGGVAAGFPALRNAGRVSGVGGGVGQDVLRPLQLVGWVPAWEAHVAPPSSASATAMFVYKPDKREKSDGLWRVCTSLSKTTLVSDKLSVTSCHKRQLACHKCQKNIA